MRSYTIMTLLAVLVCSTPELIRAQEIQAVGNGLDSTILSLPVRSQKRTSPALLQLDRQLDNPALRRYLWDFSHTEIAANAAKRKEDEAIVQQLGNQTESYGLDISSLLKPSANSRAWGRAYYDHSDKRNVNYMLSSDYDRVYPYITLDTLGPRPMKEETYFFSGGYAREIGAFGWGISGSTRNLQEYRQVDPRPRNRVSDIQITLGATYKLNNPYDIALSTQFGSYKQSQSISWLADDRVRIGSQIFNMTGLGNAFYPIRTQTSFSHEAKNVAVGADLFPREQRGLLVQLHYRYDNLHKALGGSSSIHSFLNMQEHDYRVKMGWMDFTEDRKWSVNTAYIHKHRVGAEALLVSSRMNNPNTPAYEYVHELIPYYQENTDQITVDALYEYGSSARWHVIPRLDYRKNRTDYLDPQRFLEWERLTYGLSAGWSQIKGKHLLSAEFSAGIDKSLSSAIDLSNTLTISSERYVEYEVWNRHSTWFEMANYRFIATDNRYVKVSGRWEWQLFSNKSLFLQPIYQQGWYTDDVKTRYWQVKIGMVL